MGTQFAVAPHESLGVGVSAAYLWSRTETGSDPETDNHSLETGLNVSFDLVPLVDFPLGLLAYYSMRYTHEDDGTPIHKLGFGLFYTDRSPLVLGLVEQIELSSRETASMTIYSTLLRLRYYW